MDKSVKRLQELTELNGVPGNEQEVRDYMKDILKDTADELSYDNLGSIIAKKVGNENGPKIVVAGHMDEVGFMVSEITKGGYVKFVTLGGWWSQVMLSQQVTITTRTSTIHGVIGSKAPHILTPEELKNPAKIEKMYIDIGVDSKEEAEIAGVRVGDMITPHIKFREMVNKNYLLGKAFDNRVGCAVALDVLDVLKNEKHENIVYSVGTVQEEVGLRGAQTVANMINPDIVFALDVGIAQDEPGGNNRSKMGNGPVITILDGRTIGHKALREFVVDVCEELKIPYQFDYLKRGGTDAGAMHIAHNGALAMSLSIPSRYIHSHTSMIHKQDYLNVVKLITEVTKRINSEVFEELRLK